MTKRLYLLSGIASAMLLAGCSNTGYRGLESPNQPVVTRSDYALDLQTTGSDLAPGEAQRLAGWMRSLRLGYGDRVFVDDPSGSVDAREEVADEAARYGLLLSNNAPVVPAAVTPGTVRVVVTRMRASVPGCPNFSDVGQANFDEHTSPGFGCAVNSNLAAMVARPGDLVSGEPGADTADPETAVKAIDTYRKAPPTGADGLKPMEAGAGSSGQ